MMNTTSFLLESKVELLSIFRSKGFVIPASVFPCLFYLFFGIMFSHDDSHNYMFINYLIFGMISPALFSFGVNVAIEKQNGWLVLKQLSPVSAYQYLFAKCVSASVFSLIVACLMSMLALFSGVSLALEQFLIIVLIALLGTFPLCLLGLVIGLCVSAKAAPAVVNLVYLPLSLLSGLWLPITLFPEPMQWFAWLLPTFHISQLALGVIDAALGFAIYYHLSIFTLQTCLLCFFAHTKFKQA
ncbi:ABC transporter permease [Pseudoalteromonas peptidolytica]|uniref:ABC-2 type transport system permease protein n=1 Tax=Pseudoalteromonas peptidolytica F12-50-A1 TaxID=1315280 RepID=A0A8I0T5W8_9GAMM|nr:ABC transporter permease [Pseudoalteromonas peptidolytica]MBE0348931.1 ABC-2 type transport system permease protein [Pseudoalteromonas peptidolytica F12-50-A1]NLR16329.1 ABC transporter permease [Pseudoalteromonas peptidolytica]